MEKKKKINKSEAKRTKRSEKMEKYDTNRAISETKKKRKTKQRGHESQQV